MVNVSVSFLGPIRRPWSENSRIMSVPDGCTLSEICSSLGYRPTEIPFISLSVNNEKALPDKKIKENDQIVLSLMLGGG